jgi:hypothetical protein
MLLVIEAAHAENQLTSSGSQISSLGATEVCPRDSRMTARRPIPITVVSSRWRARLRLSLSTNPNS